jgi:hypothetical protein
VDKVRDCIRRELVFLALGTMDVCIITPLVAALLSRIVPVRPLLVTLILLGAVLAVHYLARLALWLPFRPSLRYGALGLGMLVSGLLITHRLLHAQTRLLHPAWLVGIFSDLRQGAPSRELPIFLLVLFLWWRGLVLAQRRLDSDSVAFRFRLGLLMIAVTTALAGPMLSWPYHRFVFAFFFASLLGIALARAEEIGHQYGGGQSPFGLGWLATLVAAALVVLLLAGGLAALLTGENIGLVLVPALQVLHVILFYVVYILAWIAQIVIAPLVSILQQEELRRALEEFSRRIAAPGQAEPQEMQPRELPFTPEQLALVRAVGVVGGVLLLLLLVALSLRRLRAWAGQRRDEERESVWEGAQLRRDLGDLLRRGRRRVDQAAAALSRSLLGRFFAAMTIRRIYAHLGALAAERGYPRFSSQTPYEYLPTLERAFPDSREEVARITEAYVAVHYAEAPERPADLEAIQAAWDRVRETAAVRPH